MHMRQCLVNPDEGGQLECSLDARQPDHDRCGAAFAGLDHRGKNDPEVGDKSRILHTRYRYRYNKLLEPNIITIITINYLEPIIITIIKRNYLEPIIITIIKINYLEPIVITIITINYQSLLLLLFITINYLEPNIITVITRNY